MSNHSLCTELSFYSIDANDEDGNELGSPLFASTVIVQLFESSTIKFFIFLFVG